MSLTSDWQSYVPPKHRVSQSAVNFLHVESSFYTPADHRSFRKKKTTRNTFYEEMWPVLFMLKLLGLFPYCISSSGKLVFKLVSIIVSYSAVFLAVVVVGAILTVRERRRTLSLRENTFEEKIIHLTFLSVFFLFFAAPFVYCTEIWKRIQFINDWEIFQEDFCRVTGRTLDLGLKSRVRCFAAFVVTSATLGTIGLYQVDRNFEWWQYCIVAVGSLIMSLTPVLWYLICHGVMAAAKILGGELEQGMLQHGFRCTDKIVQFRFLWLRLSKMTQNIGRSMGLTYATSTLFCFGVLVISSYGFLVSVRTGFTTLTQSLACGILSTLATLYMQCATAQWASEEVGLSFQERFQSLLEKYPSGSSATHIEMDRFLAVINSNPPVINFCGFVEVNKGLITSLMSQLLTYLIVLMQINLSTQPDKSD